MASAKRGFLRGASVAAVASVFVVIRSVQVVVQIKEDGVPLAFSKVFFIEDWFGHHVFLTGPVAQVPFPAALAAEREVRVDRRVGLCFANGAFVLHGAILFFSANSVLSVTSVLKDFTRRAQRPRKRYLRKVSISQPRTRRGAPVAMR